MRPLLPTVCQSQNFLLASPAQVKEYASSTSVVSQLLESVSAWISHGDQVAQDVADFFEAFDNDCASSSTVHNDLLCDVAESLRRLELATSFCNHFTTEEILAVRRVLDVVIANNISLILVSSTSSNSGGISSASTKEKLAQLDQQLAKMSVENKELAKSKELFALLDCYCAPGSAWTLQTCDDTLPPLFCALRAIFICCPRFGKRHPMRFSTLIRCVLKRVETLVETTVPPRLLPHAISARGGVDDAMAACLAAQTAGVCLQEQFFKLRISANESVAKEFTAVIYEGIDETSFFALMDYYYDRCVILLHLLTVVKDRQEELQLSGSLLERLLQHDLLRKGVVSHDDLIEAIRSLTDAPSMKPRDIVARIESKSAEYVDMWRKREAARILESGNNAKSSSGGVVLSSIQRRSRVGERNAAANGTWSLSYGEQQAQLLAGAGNQRDAYFTIVISFPQPRIFLAGWPLKPKELEKISVAFQDALRARVSHTAASIRSNRLDMAAISTATSVLKAPYDKFRSASEDLADARFQTQERTFHKQAVAHHGTSLEAELRQLQRFHVAAAHNAHTLVVQHTHEEEPEPQSYAMQAVLDCVEMFNGDRAELATTLAFTDSDHVYSSYFVFRYLPSMPPMRQKRDD